MNFASSRYQQCTLSALHKYQCVHTISRCQSVPCQAKQSYRPASHHARPRVSLFQIPMVQPQQSLNRQCRNKERMVAAMVSISRCLVELSTGAGHKASKGKQLSTGAWHKASKGKRRPSRSRSCSVPCSISIPFQFTLPCSLVICR